MSQLLNKICYAKAWRELSREPFDAEDLELIERVVVTAGDYGLSARVEMKDDKETYYSIHRDSRELRVDEELDPTKCIIVHLVRGEATCDKLCYTAE